jgi:hypothetical protein
MVQVEVARLSDFGHNDRTFIINTHLGEQLNYNDTVLGFDLDAINLMQLEDMEFNRELQVPPIVLVKKTYPKYRKRRKHRLWKLKHLPKEEGVDEDAEAVATKGKKKGKDSNQRNEKDYQMFLQDIEEDPEIRQQIDLYRNEDVINELEKKLAGMNLEEAKKSQIQSAIDAGKGKVGKDERKIVQGARKTDEGRLKHAESEEARKKEEAIIKATLKDKNEKGAEDDEDGWDSVEEDFPHIKLDDLKKLGEQLAGMKIEGENDDDENDDDFEDDDEPQKKKKAAAKGERIEE